MKSFLVLRTIFFERGQLNSDANQQKSGRFRICRKKARKLTSAFPNSEIGESVWQNWQPNSPISQFQGFDLESSIFGQLASPKGLGGNNVCALYWLECGPVVEWWLMSFCWNKIFPVLPLDVWRIKLVVDGTEVSLCSLESDNQSQLLDGMYRKLWMLMILIC